MDGKTHRIIGPIFTVGVATCYLSTTHVAPTISKVGVTAIATAVSIFSSNWPDADQHSKSKPLPIILYGMCPPLNGLLYAMGVRKRRVRNKGGRVVSALKYKGHYYQRVKRFDMKIWAAFFRIIHARAHRCFLSHSPILWGLIWLYLCGLSLKDTTGIIMGITLGGAFGYLSHLLGDACTLDCVPLVPKLEILYNLPVIGNLYKMLANLKIFKWEACKASNKTWNIFVIIVIACFILYLCFPAVGKPLFQGAGAFLSACAELIVKLVKKLFTA